MLKTNNDSRQMTEDEILRLIVEGTAAVTGREFFRSLVRHLAATLGVRYAFASRFAKERSRVRTLAFWNREQFLDNFEYDLAGTPCEAVLKGEIRHYPSGVQILFPRDKDLSALQAESYLAIPLTDVASNVLGHLAVMDDTPLPSRTRDLSIFRIFAARAAAELQRHLVDKERQLAEQALNHRIEIEKIIATISSYFINLSSAEIDKAITQALAKIGSFAGADRGYVYLFSRGMSTMMNTHECCNAGIKSLGLGHGELPTSAYTWLTSRLRRFQVVHIPNVANLPEEAGNLRDCLESQYVTSSINVPMVSGKSLIGFLGYDMIGSEKQWPSADVRILKLAGEIFVSALERKRAEEELQKAHTHLLQTEKMAALGKLTAGIAHEINNPVGAIKSASNVSERCLEGFEKITRNGHTSEDLKNNRRLQSSFEILKANQQVIEAASNRISETLQSLKNFVRLDEAEFQKVDVREGIEDVLTLVKHEITQGVKVVTDFGDIPRIACYASELNQAFMNVLANAIRAVGDKGTIRIETFADAKEVYVRISDTGKGIPAAKLNTVFDLNFASKNSRVGLSMGLFTTKNIIERHAGEIVAASEVGKGTAVTIRLPIGDSHGVD